MSNAIEKKLACIVKSKSGYPQNTIFFICQIKLRIICDDGCTSTCKCQTQ